MNDVESARAKLAELLRHPEDLDKIPALKAEFTRKKNAIDSQLRHGLKEQLEVTQAGMNSIMDGQRTVNQIKEEMMKIDKLCAEAQNMIQDFPHINLVAQTHRNFEQVEKMKKDIDAFPQRLENLEYLLAQDDEDPANQPNLLQIHLGLTELRDIRDQAMDQIKNSEEGSMELVENLTLDSGATVQDYFARLDDIIEWFDKHIGEACINLIELVQSGNDGMVVRLALVIEEEEKQDKKVKALQDAQREYKDLASRFKSIATGPKELRGYKEKFLKAIEYVCQARFEEVKEKFHENPDRLEKSFKWFFNNLHTVKVGMQTLMPKKWKIFRTYCDIYHKQMHDWLIAQVEDEGLLPQQMLAIISWADKYYEKMQKLGVPEEDLTPHVIDNRSSDLVREYRQNIVRAVEEWMDRIGVNDKKQFLERDESALETDENGVFRTKTLGDSWRVLMENLTVAASSQRTDVVEGVVDAMFRVLSSRQRMWHSLLDAEIAKYNSSADQDNLQSLQDWIITIANDQINCIADDDEDHPSYLAVLERAIIPEVSPAYTKIIDAQITNLRDEYLGLAIACIHAFVSLIFLTDFKPILGEFFTAHWYSQKRMSAITTTYKDYLQDYMKVVHPSLQEILLTELSDELLIHYLSSVRNKGAKFRRADPFTGKIKEDVMTVFDFFNSYTDADAYNDIRNKWRAVNELVRLIEADKSQVPFVYEEVKMQYPDVQISWVEAVLRARDDFERSMLNAVKAKAAEISVQSGSETIFSKVK
ncbi:exocyst complex component Sec6 [Westerdykella ornata]|uniref:Exocyst complex component Sec6 n=1 Tax=Westerdykella ornata TaxID=318751 RepID=A0A6A6J9L0_WESOR|nr:exocyst complex component Sec6 [Westerdykella ornata]KAF2272904.1 exocyst complex component Sec6 [Westerdykella ornata]